MRRDRLLGAPSEGRRRRLAVATVILALVFAPHGTVADSPAGSRLGAVFGQRIELQQGLTNLLDERLRALARPYEVLVTVRLSLRGDIRQIGAHQEEAPAEMKIGSRQQLKLPGLPTMERPSTALTPEVSVKIPGRRGELRRELESQVERIAVRLYLDPAAPPEVRERLRGEAIDIAGLDPARGDLLDIVNLPSPAPASPRAAAAGVAPGAAPAGSWWRSVPPQSYLAFVTALACAALLGLALSLGQRRRGALEGAPGMGGDIVLQPASAPSAAGSAAQAVRSARAASEGEFEFLDGSSAAERAELLASLDISSAAALLARVGADEETARILFERLEPERRVELSAALGQTRVLHRSALSEVEALAKRELERIRSHVAVGGADALVDALSRAPSEAQRQVLEDLSRSAPELAKAVRSRMLFFEDLGALPPEAIRQVFAGIDPSTVAIALRDAPQELRGAVERSLSKRLRTIIAAEDEALGTPAESDVVVARRAVELAMRRLQMSGALRARAAS